MATPIGNIKKGKMIEINLFISGSIHKSFPSLRRFLQNSERADLLFCDGLNGVEFSGRCDDCEFWTFGLLK
jgi:hypothetical protein